MNFTQDIFEYLIDNIPGDFGIYRDQGDGLRTLYQSEQLHALCGMERSEFDALTENDAGALVLEADRPALRESLRACRPGEKAELLYRVRHAVRGVEWVRTRVSLCGDEDGGRVYLMLFTTMAPEKNIYQKLLDHSEGMVYVCDAETREILYLNRAARAYAKDRSGSFTGKTCYQYVRGENAVCADCYLNRLEPGQNLHTEGYNPALSRFESAAAEYIRWGGHNAFVVYLNDVTDAVRRRSELENIFRSEKRLTGDIQILTGEGTLAERLNALMADMGEYFAADRAYICEYDAGRKTISETYEFCRAGVVPQIDKFINVDVEFLARWLPFFDRHEAVIIPDIGEIRDNSPVEYELFTDQDIVSYMEAPIIIDGVIAGFIGVDNPSPERMRHSGDLLLSLAYFVSAAMVRAKNERSLLEAQEKEKERFRRSVQTTLSANPEALCTFQLNLTQNLCYDGHGASEFILRALQSGTADGLFKNAAALAAEGDGQKFLAVFDRGSLLERFRAGEDAVHLDYRRIGEDGRPFRARSFLKMMENPDTGDVEGVIYSLDVTREVQHEAIFRIITSREYDLIALLHLDTGRFEPVFLGDTLPAAYRAALPAPGGDCDFHGFCRVAAEKWVDADQMATYRANAGFYYFRRELDRTGHYDFTLSEHFDDYPGGRMMRRFQHYYLGDDHDTVLVIESDVTAEYRRREEAAEREKAAAAARLAEEKALREAATAASNAKSEFLSRMSHDIRTPLNGIMGMTYLAKQEENPPRTQDCLEKIDMSSRFLLGLVNDILDMSKAESGMIELHPEPYRPADMVRYLDAVIVPLCREKNIRFRLEGGSPPGVVPLMDVLRTNQIYFNLLSNAVKYTSPGGEVLCRMTLAPAAEGKLDAEFRVKDNGIGMSEEFQKVLFEPFTQENRSDVSERRGSGLGLAIVKRMTDLMGGTITVKSRVGEGTEFVLAAQIDCVPEESLRPAAGQAGERDAAALSGTRVLLCEDHPLNREIAAALLAELGIAAVTAENGAEGAEIFERSEPGYFDAVLMDIRMPVLDGYGAAERIRALDRADARTVPVIAMTADAFADDVEKCRAAGMDGHIAKPVDLRALKEILLKLLKH